MTYRGQQNFYNHADFVECMNMDQFSQHFAFTDKSGKILGKNLVYALMRKMGVLKKDNEPHQCFVGSGYIRCLNKSYYQGGKRIPKNIVFITPKGIEHFPPKINEFIQDKTQGRLTLEIINNLNTKPESVEGGGKVVEFAKPAQSSQPEMTREQVIEVLAKLPESMQNSVMAKTLRRKHGIDG